MPDNRIWHAPGIPSPAIAQVSDDVFEKVVVPEYIESLGKALPKFGVFAKGGRLTPEKLSSIRAQRDAGTETAVHDWCNIKGVVRKLATVDITRKVEVRVLFELR